MRFIVIIAKKIINMQTEWANVQKERELGFLVEVAYAPLSKTLK
jgi:hypothetical protein